MQRGCVLKTLNFDLLTPIFMVGVGDLWAKYLLPCCCICNSLQFDMQHDHFLKKKFNFDCLTPKAGSVGRGGVCGQSSCYHATAFVIIFNLTMV